MKPQDPGCVEPRRGGSGGIIFDFVDAGTDGRSTRRLLTPGHVRDLHVARNFWILDPQTITCARFA
jgi:hypothetical protein